MPVRAPRTPPPPAPSPRAGNRPLRGTDSAFMTATQGASHQPASRAEHGSGPRVPYRPGIAQTIAGRVWPGTGPGVSLNARETCRDAAPAMGKTAEAKVSMGYPDRVRQARVFPGPPGSRPARSLIYTHGGDLYKATIGRPVGDTACRRPVPRSSAGGPKGRRAAARSSRSW